MTLTVIKEKTVTQRVGKFKSDVTYKLIKEGGGRAPTLWHVSIGDDCYLETFYISGKAMDYFKKVAT